MVRFFMEGKIVRPEELKPADVRTVYRMVFRNMFTEIIGYYKQWKLKRNAHERSADLTGGAN